MIKLVDPAGFNFDQPIMSLMEVHSRGVESGWLKKTAAVLTKEISELRPDPNYTFVHLIALGDWETSGINRNGDAFSKEANIKHHKTFEKHANFYRNHKNKPHRGDQVYGCVKHAAYNDEMGRVELVIGISNKDAPDTIQKLASGKDLPVSMAAKLPFDRCNICKKSSKSTDEYCDHLKKHAGQILADGRQVCMINEDPTFFDISEVVRNADRIAFSLRKVASAGFEFSADQARDQGVTAPASLGDPRAEDRIRFLHKLAMMEGELAKRAAHDSSTRNVAAALSSPIDADVTPKDDNQLRAIFGFFKTAKVSLPFDDFIKIVCGPNSDAVRYSDSAKASLSSVFKEASADPDDFLDGINNYEPLDTTLPTPLKTLISGIASRGSLTEGPMNGRIIKVALTKGLPRMNKSASVSDKGKMLAREYAKYKFAFLEGMDDGTISLGLLQNLA